MRPFDTSVVSPVLVGRAREMDTLERALEAAQQGTGQCILLAGDAGIGKSRLLVEIRQRASAEQFVVLQGHCFEQDSAFPYAPLIDALRTYFARQSTPTRRESLGAFAAEVVKLLPELAVSLSDLQPSAALEPEAEKRRLFEAVAQYLTLVSTSQPLLVIIEDLHWSDETSLDFLHFFARRLPAYPILLLASYRHEDVSPRLAQLLVQFDRTRLAHEIRLAPLARTQVEMMLRAIFALDQPIQSEFLDLLVPLTEGNPFFVEEMLKALLDAGDIFYADGAWDRKPITDLHIPRSVQDAVQRRSQHLSPAARHTLILAAVAGRRFDFGLLQHLTQYTEQQLVDVVKELIAAQLVVEATAEQFAFRHALTRQAVYSGLLARERQALHHTIAETMQRVYVDALETHLADLAYHYHEAGEWECALEYAQRAGEQAAALFALHPAIEQFTRAVDAAQHLSKSPSPHIYHLRGQVYETMGDFERARDDYAHALSIARHTEDRMAEWRSLIDLGSLWAGRDYERTGGFFREAVELAQSLADPAAHARSLNRLGNWLVNVGWSVESLQAHREALAIFQAQGDQQGIAETLDLLGMAHTLDGDVIRAVNHWEQAIGVFRSLDDIKGLISSLTTRGIMASPSNIETAWSALGTRDQCVADIAEALRLACQIDSRAAQAYAELGAGKVFAAFGEFGAALAHAHESLRIATEIDHQQWIVGAYYVLGKIYVAMLHPAFAIQALKAALPLAQGLGSAWWIGNTSAYLARAYVLNHDLPRAEATLKAGIPRDQLPRTYAERRMVWAWGEVALAQGQPSIALRIAEQLIESAPGGPNSQAISALLQLKGEALLTLQRLDEAEQVLEGAKQGAVERHERPRLWQIHRALGRLHQQYKHEDQAQQEFVSARTVIESLAATIDDTSLREHFVHAALESLPKSRPISSRRSEANKFGGLTMRERQVAALLAQGCTNREIASALVVTERTVEAHVGNMLSKLDFTSRAQIAVWAVEKGLTHGLESLDQ